MAEEGLDSLFPLSELAIMGLIEVLPRVPRLLARLRQTADFVLARRPLAVITIDAPGFNFRLGRRLQGRGIPLIHYVAPTVWAWRPGRAAKIARFLDHLLLLLPFESPYFEAVGLDCSFVGHPVVETQVAGDGAAFRRQHGMAPEAPLLAVLFRQLYRIFVKSFKLSVTKAIESGKTYISILDYINSSKITSALHS